MKRFCGQCGTELEDGMMYCPECGVKWENTDGDNKDAHEETQEIFNSDRDPSSVLSQKKSKRPKKVHIILIVCICVIGAAALGVFVIYPQVTLYLEQKENEEKAEKVSNQIETLTEKEITLSVEDDLNDIQKEYNALSADQKKLVKNYDKLEEAAASLEKLKKEEEDKEKAQEIIDRLDSVNKDALAYDDTSIQEIRSAYDKLTDDQKKLVTNADLLSEYEAVVQEKKDQKAREDQQAQEEQAKRSLVSETFANLTYYDGLWDDFGAHVNKYQGAVEAAIKSAIRTSDYFDDPYSISMILTKQHDCYFVSFEGVPSGNPNSGARRLDLVVNAPDGMNFVCTVGDYYQL